MKHNGRKTLMRENTARNAWIALGGLVALAVIVLTIREVPSMQRELRILRM
jgi:hypothetical protein